MTRVRVNLIFFAVVGVLMTVWAVSTIISIDALRRPFRVTAQFGGAPGLRPDLEVAYLGVRVGKIGKVKLRSGYVDVGLDLERGSKVPANAGAKVLRKSAIGEPYIELTQPDSSPSRPLKAGDQIPLARTTYTVEYKRFFASAERLLQAVRPQDARILVNEISTGLDGRSQALRDTIADAHQLTGTLAANAALLDALSTELTRTTGILADHRQELHSGANSLAAFTAALRDSRADLTKVLNGGPGFLRDTGRFVDIARPGLSCLLTAAGAQTTPLLTSQHARDLRRGLVNFPLLERTVNDVVVKRPKGDAWLKATFVISIAGPPAAAEFARPTPKPIPPALAYCRALTRSVESAPVKQPGTAPQPTPTAPTDQFGISSPVAGKEAYTQSPKTASTTSRMLPLLPIVLAAVVLLGAVANALSAARRRRSL